MNREIDNAPVKMNLLRLDLTKVRLDVVHAMDAAIGTETVSSIATRHGAFAGINAGFFRLDTSIFAGDAAGVLMIDRLLISESINNRIALFIDNFQPDRTIVKFAHIDINDTIRIKGKEFRYSGINRERKDDELIEYRPVFHRTTLTGNDGLEVIVRKGKITAILDGKGSSVIPQDGFVISASGKKRAEILPFLKIGRKVKGYSGIRNSAAKGFPNEESNRTSQAFSRAEDITNGIPQLIKNGKIEITWEKEKTSRSFVETRHPRTAAAILKDGKFLMITVDGRTEESGGIGLEDLAKLLLEFGATDAMNLDGGGSTTMFLDGKVVNKPSDKTGERKVSDAILVFPRKYN
ncbi:MAG: phosphodiester glycosidase family protein [Acidobacteria bacterium]|nr:phosphodiester glycosidase family protein [Acidobacteriota bacterium]